MCTTVNTCNCSHQTHSIQNTTYLSIVCWSPAFFSFSVFTALTRESNDLLSTTSPSVSSMTSWRNFLHKWEIVVLAFCFCICIIKYTVYKAKQIYDVDVCSLILHVYHRRHQNVIRTWSVATSLFWPHFASSVINYWTDRLTLDNIHRTYKYM